MPSALAVVTVRPAGLKATNVRNTQPVMTPEYQAYLRNFHAPAEHDRAYPVGDTCSQAPPAAWYKSDPAAFSNRPPDFDNYQKYWSAPAEHDKAPAPAPRSDRPPDFDNYLKYWRAPGEH